MGKSIIKTASYTANLPKNSCKVKVAIKQVGWEKQGMVKTEVFENATYESGFVTINDKEYYLASLFIFHKLKRNKI